VDDLTKEFLAESFEGLDRMDRCLTELEDRPTDEPLLAEIFRAVHTIKGTTGFLGFHRLEKLSHAGEHVLGLLRDGRLEVNERLIGGLLQLMDGLRSILYLIEKTGKEGTRTDDHDSSLLQLLCELAQAGTTVKQPDQRMPESSLGPFADEPEHMCGNPDEVDGKQAEATRSSEAVAVLERRLVSQGSAGISTSGISEKTLRVDVEVLNRMMNLVGELVLTRNQMLQTILETARFGELTRRLDNVTADLRETVMQARMQPVGHIFGKFPRLVRDLAKSCGKLVRMEFTGQDTGLDKSLLEAIKDPLMHAVKNAIDHGIEVASERISLGKAPQGLLCLRAFHQSGYVVIEVVDDGGGINTNKLRANAIDRGLITGEQAMAMTDHELHQLIFLPGFSTVEQVTLLSGRGVGMDVVRANIEQVNGTVEVFSKTGRGTVLRLRVPLTLAIVPALIVQSGGQRFCVPQGALAELVHVPGREANAAVESIGEAEFYRLRDKLLPLVWLDGLLRLPRAERVAGFYLVVLDADGCSFGLVVDDLMTPEEIVVKPLSTVLREIGLFSGATVLGNGTLAMILDVVAVAARAGVRPVVENKPNRIEGDRKAVEANPSFLVYESRVRGGPVERTALPLDAVEHIESVALGAIEVVAGRLLLQYRGDLLPLEDEGDLLGELAGVQASELVTVLICRRKNGERVGMIVRRAVDVASGIALDVRSDLGNARLTVVKERLMAVHSGFAEATDLREVA
jgi:two-component system chemotaxis sensor kinase CheA